MRTGQLLSVKACLVVASSAPVRAQEVPTLTAPLAREMLSCITIDEDAARLACFDAVNEQRFH